MKSPAIRLGAREYENEQLPKTIARLMAGGASLSLLQRSQRGGALASGPRPWRAGVFLPGALPAGLPADRPLAPLPRNRERLAPPAMRRIGVGRRIRSHAWCFVMGVHETRR